MALNRRSLLKGLAATTAATLMPRQQSAAHIHLHQRLSRSTPESQGVASAAIVKFLADIGQAGQELHSFMFTRHGHVIAEGWWKPYRPEAIHTLYSLSKSFTSTAVGFAVMEGKLRIADHVIDFFPSQLPASVSENLYNLTVEHLLTMSVGRKYDSTGVMQNGDDWVKAFLSIPIGEPPGSVFYYDNCASYMLSAIVQVVTGERVFDYLQRRLFSRLGIHDGLRWDTCPRGINTGGWGLSVTTETIAKFGQFYLQRGKWNGEQLLPAEWIDAATSYKIQQPATWGPAVDTGCRVPCQATLDQLKDTSDWYQGYGYQFWRCRHNAYRAIGVFGQMCVVMPEQDAVLSLTGENGADLVQDLIWKHLLPAMSDTPLPPNRHLHKQLTRVLDSASLQPPSGRPMTRNQQRVSGRRFVIEANGLRVRHVALEFNQDSCLFTLADGSTMHQVRCGFGKWLDGLTSMPGTPPNIFRVVHPHPSRISSAAAWKDDNTLEMRWCYFETPHKDVVTCKFAGDRIDIRFVSSIAQHFARESGSEAEERLRLRGILDEYG